MWDKDNECYVQDEADWCYLKFDGTIDCGTPSDFETLPEWHLEQKNAVIEQCTGMKDKNGKYIFENDIISKEFVYYKNLVKQTEILKYRVIWYQMKFIIENINDSSDTAMVWCPSSFEVIWNTHEMDNINEN